LLHWVFLNFSQLPFGCNGCQSSKIRDGDSQYTKDLRSYEESCKKDPRLQLFDDKLRQRTNHVVNSLATVNFDIRSLDPFKDVTNCLLNLNQDVVNFILKATKIYGIIQDCIIWLRNTLIVVSKLWIFVLN
jgi:hypothetical protein